jgi:hypothetical protein
MPIITLPIFLKMREVSLRRTNVIGLPFLWFISLGKQRNEPIEKLGLPSNFCSLLNFFKKLSKH